MTSYPMTLDGERCMLTPDGADLADAWERGERARVVEAVRPDRWLALKVYRALKARGAESGYLKTLEESGVLA